jgi:DNA-binding winged helix-turn-helix (wHTH) protein
VVLRFASCRLDLDARRLFRGAEEVHLSPKAFSVLQVLVEGRPHAFSKSELLEQVWPGVFVSEASLARVVNEVRNGVGDDASAARIIRTIHAYGYAFAAEAVEDGSAPPPSRGAERRPIGWLTSGAKEFALWEGEQVVGRDASADVVLDSPKVSRQHARITVRGVLPTIEDLGSKNGTHVRGERIGAPTALAPGDSVRIGPFTLVFSLVSAFGPTETQSV